MKVYAIESRFDVPGTRSWLLYSGTHFYKTQAEAQKAIQKLSHKQHPLPIEFRVTPYVPATSES
jgi:hypothetical protein